MQISLEDVENEAEPYKIFLESLKSKDTYRKYKSNLSHFLLAIPSSVFDEYAGCQCRQLVGHPLEDA